MNAIELKAYAKINLMLDVTGRREDGYHTVDMVMAQVDLCDRIVLKTESAANPQKEFLPSVCLDIVGADLAADSTNLAWKAAVLMQGVYREQTGRTAPAVQIRIEKKIPIAAGLAGGSADGAAVLIGLNQLWKMKLTLPELMTLGCRLGADVPFCLMGQAALQPELGLEGGASCARAQGIGECLTPLPPLSLWALLIKPESLALSTAEVYQALDELEETVSLPHPEVSVFVEQLKKQNVEKIFPVMGNLLEKVVLFRYPIVKYTKNKINTKAGAACALMSGSGPTVFGLYRTEADCRTGWAAVKDEFPCAKVVRLL